VAIITAKGLGWSKVVTFEQLQAAWKNRSWTNLRSRCFQCDWNGYLALK
jgi:hypothetical protein